MNTEEFETEMRRLRVKFGERQYDPETTRSAWNSFGQFPHIEFRSMVNFIVDNYRAGQAPNVRELRELFPKFQRRNPTIGEKNPDSDFEWMRRFGWPRGLEALVITRLHDKTDGIAYGLKLHGIDQDTLDYLVKVARERDYENAWAADIVEEIRARRARETK